MARSMDDTEIKRLEAEVAASMRACNSRQDRTLRRVNSSNFRIALEKKETGLIPRPEIGKK